MGGYVPVFRQKHIGMQQLIWERVLNKQSSFSGYCWKKKFFKLSIIISWLINNNSNNNDGNDYVV